MRANGVILPGDENGVFPNETTPDFPPRRIKKIQAYEVKFVKEWMKGE